MSMPKEDRMDNKCEQCGEEYIQWVGKDTGLCPQCLFDRLVIAGKIREDNTLVIDVDDPSTIGRLTIQVPCDRPSTSKIRAAICKKCKKCWYWRSPDQFVGECPRWNKEGNPE